MLAVRLVEGGHVNLQHIYCGNFQGRALLYTRLRIMLLSWVISSFPVLFVQSQQQLCKPSCAVKIRLLAKFVWLQDGEKGSVVVVVCHKAISQSN